MSIELDRSFIEPRVRRAITENLAVWRAKDRSEIYMLTEFIIEVMWEVAAQTKDHGAEKGIIAGIRMMQNWKD